jgi:Flavin containing amine oxidoreductase
MCPSPGRPAHPRCRVSRTGTGRGQRPTPRARSSRSCTRSRHRRGAGSTGSRRRTGETWASRLAALRPELSTDPGRALLTCWNADPWAEESYSALTIDVADGDDELVAVRLGRVHFAGEHTARSWAGLGSSLGTALVGSVLVAAGLPFAAAATLLLGVALIGPGLSVLIPRQQAQAEAGAGGPTKPD